MKKSLLIVYSKMIVGGSTSSLLSLLNEIDYTQYNVDLLLFEKGGVLDNQIPSKVNILDNGFLHINKKRFTYIWAFANAFIKSKINRNHFIRSQLMSKQLASSQPTLPKKYDIAIAYLEFWPSHYVNQRVNAEKKIVWLHCDYKGSGLDPRCDKQMYNNVDAVITVSKACEDNFRELFPKAKTYTIHNILSAKTILGLSNSFEADEGLYDADFNFVTVARIDFTSKGHDRAVNVFKKIKEKYPNKTFKWLIIGDGPNRAQLEDLIEKANLKNEITLLGEMVNPHPYVKKADIFLLPSRYEGKPMAVTEAQMNGVVPFVTDYASAKGQIRNMQDGLICENNDDAIIDMMGRIFSGEINLELMKKEVLQTDYSNYDEITKINKLLQ